MVTSTMDFKITLHFMTEQVDRRQKKSNTSLSVSNLHSNPLRQHVVCYFNWLWFFSYVSGGFA